MPIRLWAALMMCLVPAVVSAAPFVELPAGRPFASLEFYASGHPCSYPGDDRADAAGEATLARGPSSSVTSIELPDRVKVPASVWAAKSFWAEISEQRDKTFFDAEPVFETREPFCLIEADRPVNRDRIYAYMIPYPQEPSLVDARFPIGGSWSISKSLFRGYSFETRTAGPVKPGTPSVRCSTRRLKVYLDPASITYYDSASLEVWITRDGWCWQQYRHEIASTGPLVVELPEQGRYGLRVVIPTCPRFMIWPGTDHFIIRPKVRLTTQFDSPSSRNGDQAQIWIEFDESLPMYDGWAVSEELMHATSPPATDPWSPRPWQIESRDQYAWIVPTTIPPEMGHKRESRPVGLIRRIDAEKVKVQPQSQQGFRF